MSDLRMETARRIAERINHMVDGDIIATRDRLQIMGMRPAHLEIYFEALAHAALREAAEQAEKKGKPNV